jgi:hypothetical protein
MLADNRIAENAVGTVGDRTQRFADCPARDRTRPQHHRL